MGTAIVLMLCAAPAAAQEVNGDLEGRVVDAAGQPLPNARVVLSGTAMIGSRIGRADERGRFHIPSVPVGPYSIDVSLIGYRTLHAELAVQLGRTTDAGTLVLSVEAIEVSGDSVSARKQSRLDPSSAWIGDRIEVAAVRSLPVDRDYQSVVTLLPHANESYTRDRANLLGTTGAESKYFVDGANTVEPPGNALSTSVPYNFIEQIEVRGGGYEAEFGGAGGGIVNAVTMSGGNQLHGQVFGFYGSRLLTSAAGALAVTEKTSTFGAWDGGFTLGGPIRVDRLWFSVAYNPTGERETIHLSGIPEQDDRRFAHRYAGKLTWRADDATTIALSAIGDPSDRDQVGGVVLARAVTVASPDAVLADQRGGGANFSLKATRLLGPSAWMDALVTRSDSRYSQIAQTERGRTDPLYLDARTGYVEGGMGSYVDRYAGRTAAQLFLAAQRGPHYLKTGLLYEDEFFGERNDLNQITRSKDSLYRWVTLPDWHSHNHIRAPAAFVQDSWQAGSEVRLHFGLRWSGEYWMTSDGHMGQRILDGWQPRAGIAWKPAATSMKLFGSYGRFAQQTRLNLPQYFQQDVKDVFLVRDFDHDPRLDPSGGSPSFAQVLGRQDEVHGLRGAAFDEFQLGAEWMVFGGWQGTLRGVLRRQSDAIVAVLSPLTLQAVYGNPGRGELSTYPEVRRDYQALELSLQRSNASSQFRLGYVLARSRGNYEGYWDQTAAQNDPLGGASFAPALSAFANAEGPLPNDRTHVLKAQISARANRWLEAGATLLWSSGTPLSELGATPLGAPFYVFLSPRGSLGRSPAIYDLGLRLAHEAQWSKLWGGAPKL